MPTPLLLLSPDGSRDRSGAVTPTLGGSVTVVAGQYGQAWSIPPSNTVTAPASGHVNTPAGTVLVRGIFVATPLTDYFVISKGTDGVMLGRNDNGQLLAFLGTALVLGSGSDLVPQDTSTVLAISWDATTITAYKDGVFSASTALVAEPVNGSTFALNSGNDAVVKVESVLVYDVALTPGQIAHLSQPRAWTWNMLPDGALSANVTIEPMLTANVTIEPVLTFTMEFVP